MDVMFDCCAGLDVHKRTVVGCRVQGGGREHRQETCSFGTTTEELLGLLDWLTEWGCTHVAMESTGEYWKPVYNILEGHVEILLINAQHIKAVPGRKTDVKDAEWIADLLRHGLVRPSFVPPRPQRELRDLTRQRSNLVRERSAVFNRIEKVLEGANIKLGAVTSAMTGASVRAMLQAMAAGEMEVEALAELSRGRLRGKRSELKRALAGRLTAHHRFLLDSHLQHIEFLEEQIKRFSQEIVVQMDLLNPDSGLSSPPDGEAGETQSATTEEQRQPPLTAQLALKLLDTIPGIDVWQAQVILAEIGLNMRRFPTAAHLASWAGLAPGNNESAGKRRSSRTRHGNATLCKALVLAANAAARTKNTYLAAQYHRLAARRGAKRAIVALAHTILVIIYHLLTRQEPYRELGANYFDERKRDAVTNRLVRRLQKLGYDVALAPKPVLAGAPT